MHIIFPAKICALIFSLKVRLAFINRVYVQNLSKLCSFLYAFFFLQEEVLASFVSVTYHGNTELDLVEQSPSSGQSKHHTVLATSHSNVEEVVPHCETSNVIVVKRRKKHAVEDM